MSGRKPKGHAKKSGGQAEDQLSLLGRPEVLYKNLADTSPDAIFIGNTESVVVYASPSCLDIFGYTPEEFISDPQIAMKIIHPDCRPQLIEFWENYAKTKIFPEEPSEWAWIRKDNKVVYTENTFRTLYNETGEVIGFQTIARDITERKKDLENFQFLSAITGQVSDSVLATNKNFEITWVNRSFEHLYGYSLEEILGRTPDFLTAETSSEQIKNIYQTVSSGKIWTSEAIHRKKDGSLFSCELDIFPLLDEKGDIFAYAGRQRNITERKKSEDALRESEEKFRTLFENVNDAIVYVDKRGKVLSVNKRLEEIFGYKLDELKGKNFAKVCVSPKDLPRILKVFKNSIRVGKVQNPIELKIISKKGDKTSVEANASLVKKNGKIVGIVGVIRDITERKKSDEALRESEEKFRILAEKSPNMIFINKKGRIIYANEKCEEIMGYKREELHSPDFNFLSLIAPESVDTVKANYGKHMKGEDVPPYEYSIISKSGKKIDGIHTTRLIKYEGDSAILGIITDITERKKAEKELEHYRYHLEDLVKERTTDLTKANERLKLEVNERRIAEKAQRESEERFRLLTEGSLVGVYIIQGDKFRYVNPSLAKNFGYTPDELIDKLGPIDLTHPNDQSVVAEQFQRRLNGELKSSHFTFRGLRIDGGAVHCEVLGRRIDYQGHPAIIGTMMDISERKIAELEMRRRLMKFRLEDGKLYMVEEPELTLSLEAFKELLGVGYRGLIISRTPEAEFKKHVEDEIRFLWLAEKGGKKALPPKVGEIEVRIEKLSGRMAILIDRLDYLIFKNGFKKTLSFVQNLREHASLKELIIILSIDPSTLSKRELRLLEKETSEIEPMHREIPKDLHEVLRFVYHQNLVGVKPTYTDVRLEMGVSKPTVRKKIRQLSSIGYIIENKKGMYKVVELTDKGKSLFSR